MLAASAATKMTDGPSRLKPSDLPSAVAHTASSTPDTTRTNHDMTASNGPSCRTPGTAPLVREPCRGLGAKVAHPGDGRQRPRAVRLGLAADVDLVGLVDQVG